ncbi:hypothetical protein MMC13_004841 [Lambiella insularis]|nr:hypothetical protein [Lambiella insularis]
MFDNKLQLPIVGVIPPQLLTVDTNLVQQIVDEVRNMDATDSSIGTYTEIYSRMVFPPLGFDSNPQMTRQYRVPALQHVTTGRDFGEHEAYLKPPPNAPEGKTSDPPNAPPTTQRLKDRSAHSFPNANSASSRASKGATSTQSSLVSEWYTIPSVAPGFLFTVALRYWISENVLQPETVKQAHSWVPRPYTNNNLRFFSPYLTVDFVEEGKSAHEVRSKLAVASSVPLYQEFLLFKLRKERRAKERKATATGYRLSNPARSEFTRQFLHWGILCDKAWFEIYAIEARLDNTQDNWTGCKASIVKRGFLKDPDDVTSLLNWVNHIHRWGGGTRARNFKEDLHQLPKPDTIFQLLPVAGPSDAAKQNEMAEQSDGAVQTDVADQSDGTVQTGGETGVIV